MSFYPDGYEVKYPPSDYMRLPEGDHRIRILRSPIMGYESWIEEDGARKPQRFRSFQEAVNAHSIDGKIKEFHAFIVWDYEASMVRLLNITQKQIQKSIYDYAIDEDWGDPTNYDIAIKRTGKTMNDTEYSVIAKPAKPLSEEVKKAYSLVKINEDLYFTGGHPIVREEAQNDGKEMLRKTAEALGAKPVNSEELAGDVPF